MDVRYVFRLILEINCKYLPNSINQTVFTVR